MDWCAPAAAAAASAALAGTTRSLPRNTQKIASNLFVCALTSGRSPSTGRDAMFAYSTIKLVRVQDRRLASSHAIFYPYTAPN